MATPFLIVMYTFSTLFVIVIWLLLITAYVYYVEQKSKPLQLEKDYFKVDSSNFIKYKYGKHNKDKTIIEDKNWNQFFTFKAALEETKKAWKKLPTLQQISVMLQEWDKEFIIKNKFTINKFFDIDMEDLTEWFTLIWATSQWMLWNKKAYHIVVNRTLLYVDSDENIESEYLPIRCIKNIS